MTQRRILMMNPPKPPTPARRITTAAAIAGTGCLILSGLLPAPVGATDALPATGHHRSPPQVEITDLGAVGQPASAAVAVNAYGKAAGNATDPQTGMSSAVGWVHDEPARFADSARALQINDRNQIIGALEEGASTHAAIWDGRTGEQTVIRPDALFSAAVDINDRGEVLIWYALPSDDGDPPVHRAAIWYRGQETPVLPTRGPGPDIGGPRARPVAFNTRGEVAINVDGTPEETARAYYWRDGEALPIGSGRAGGTKAVAIDEHGWVAGNTTTAQGDQRAFVWRNGTMTGLGTLGGTTSEVATNPARPDHQAMSDAGHIVGTSTTADGAEHGFVWQDGTMTDLGTLGGDSTQPTAVNDRGEVVGHSLNGDHEQRPFYWYAGTMTDLGTLGGGIGHAYGLNEHGVIVGASRTASGAHHATLWRLTTPGQAGT